MIRFDLLLSKAVAAVIVIVAAAVVVVVVVVVTAVAAVAASAPQAVLPLDREFITDIAHLKHIRCLICEA